MIELGSKKVWGINWDELEGLRGNPRWVEFHYRVNQRIKKGQNKKMFLVGMLDGEDYYLMPAAK